METTPSDDGDGRVKTKKTRTKKQSGKKNTMDSFQDGGQQQHNSNSEATEYSMQMGSSHMNSDMNNYPPNSNDPNMNPENFNRMNDMNPNSMPNYSAFNRGGFNMPEHHGEFNNQSAQFPFSQGNMRPSYPSMGKPGPGMSPSRPGMMPHQGMNMMSPPGPGYNQPRGMMSGQSASQQSGPTPTLNQLLQTSNSNPRFPNNFGEYPPGSKPGSDMGPGNMPYNMPQNWNSGPRGMTPFPPAPMPGGSPYRNQMHSQFTPGGNAAIPFNQSGPPSSQSNPMYLSPQHSQSANQSPTSHSSQPGTPQSQSGVQQSPVHNQTSPVPPSMNENSRSSIKGQNDDSDGGTKMDSSSQDEGDSLQDTPTSTSLHPSLSSLRRVPSPAGSTGSRSNTPASLPGNHPGSPMPPRPPSGQIDGQGRLTQSPMATQGYNQQIMPPPIGPNQGPYGAGPQGPGPNKMGSSGGPMPGHFPPYNSQYPGGGNQGSYGRMPNPGGMSNYPPQNMYNGPNPMGGNNPVYNNMPRHNMPNSNYSNAYGQGNMGMPNQYGSYNNMGPNGPQPMNSVRPGFNNMPSSDSQNPPKGANAAAAAAQAAMIAAANSAGNIRPALNQSRMNTYPSMNHSGPIGQLNHMTVGLGAPPMNNAPNNMNQPNNSNIVSNSASQNSATNASVSPKDNQAKMNTQPVTSASLSPGANNSSNLHDSSTNQNTENNSNVNCVSQSDVSSDQPNKKPINNTESDKNVNNVPSNDSSGQGHGDMSSKMSTPNEASQTVPPGGEDQMSNSSDSMSSNPNAIGTQTIITPPSQITNQSNMSQNAPEPVVPGNNLPSYPDEPPEKKKKDYGYLSPAGSMAHSPGGVSISSYDEYDVTSPGVTGQKSGSVDLSKLYEMGNEPDRKLFIDKLLSFNEEKGAPITGMPAISKQPLDLYKLYHCVKERGGMIEVNKVKKWKEICTIVNIGSSASAAFTLKKNYIKYLFHFECHYDRGGMDPQPILAQMEAALAQKREQKNKRAPSPAGSQGSSQDAFRPPSTPNSQGLDPFSPGPGMNPHYMNDQGMGGMGGMMSHGGMMNPMNPHNSMMGPGHMGGMPHHGMMSGNNMMGGMGPNSMMGHGGNMGPNMMGPGNMMRQNNMMGGNMPNSMGGNMPSNMGNMPNNMGNMPNNMGGNMGNMPSSMSGNMPNSMGHMPNTMGGNVPNNMGNMPNNMGNMPNSMSGNMPNAMSGNMPNQMGNHIPFSNQNTNGPGQMGNMPLSSMSSSMPGHNTSAPMPNSGNMPSTMPSSMPNPSMAGSPMPMNMPKSSQGQMGNSMMPGNMPNSSGPGGMPNSSTAGNMPPSSNTGSIPSTTSGSMPNSSIATTSNSPMPTSMGTNNSMPNSMPNTSNSGMPNSSMPGNMPNSGMPNSSMPGNMPNSGMPGNMANSSMGGNMPNSSMSGNMPNSSMGGNMPGNMMHGNMPNSSMGGNMPPMPMPGNMNSMGGPGNMPHMYGNMPNASMPSNIPNSSMPGNMHQQMGNSMHGNMMSNMGGNSLMSTGMPNAMPSGNPNAMTGNGPNSMHNPMMNSGMPYQMGGPHPNSTMPSNVPTTSTATTIDSTATINSSSMQRNSGPINTGNMPNTMLSSSSGPAPNEASPNSTSSNTNDATRLSSPMSVSSSSTPNTGTPISEPNKPNQAPTPTPSTAQPASTTQTPGNSESVSVQDPFADDMSSGNRTNMPQFNKMPPGNPNFPQTSGPNMPPFSANTSTPNMTDPYRRGGTAEFPNRPDFNGPNQYPVRPGGQFAFGNQFDRPESNAPGTPNQNIRMGGPMNTPNTPYGGRYGNQGMPMRPNGPQDQYSGTPGYHGNSYGPRPMGNQDQYSGYQGSYPGPRPPFGTPNKRYPDMPSGPRDGNQWSPMRYQHNPNYMPPGAPGTPPMGPYGQPMGPRHPRMKSMKQKAPFQPQVSQKRTEIPFPPDTIEGIHPLLIKRRRLNSKDLGPIDSWRLMMALKSGLLTESTWALDTLNILLFDDTTVSYFNLSHLPGLLDVLLEHFRKCIYEVFIDMIDFEEDITKPDANVDMSSEEKLDSVNYTLVTRNGKEVEVEEESMDGWMLEPKTWDRCNEVMADENFGHLEHIMTKMESEKTNTLLSKLFSKYHGKHKDKRKVFTKDSVAFEDDTDSDKDKINIEEMIESEKISSNKEYVRNNFIKSEPKSMDEEDSKDNKPEIKMEVDADADTDKEKDEYEKTEGEETPTDTESNMKEDLPYHSPTTYQKTSVEVMSLTAMATRPQSSNDLEEEAYEYDKPPLYNTAYAHEELAKRCTCISNIFRSLSCIPGNGLELSQHLGLMSTLGKLLLLHHRHLPRSKKHKFDKDLSDWNDNEDGLKEGEWWWACLDTLRENTLVIYANISGKLKLADYPENIAFPILDGLLHWVVCSSSCARDPMPNMPPNSVLSPQRLVLEALCKLCIHDTNVDLLLATPPFERMIDLFETLVKLLANRKEQVTQEFSIVLLSELVKGDSSIARALALQHQCISLLVDFLETAEQNAHQVAKSQGISVLQNNPESMGTSLDMLRRSATILVHLARVEENRTLFVHQQSRILALVMSQILDQTVAKILSDVLFECSQLS